MLTDSLQFATKFHFTLLKRRALQCNTEQRHQEEFSCSYSESTLNNIVPKPFVRGNLLLFSCCMFGQVSPSPSMNEQH